MQFYQSQFTYEDFVREKEIKNNILINQSEDSEHPSAEEELEISSSDEDEKINKMDLDQAYELYLTKKQEIMKTYKQVEENNDNDE